MEDEEGVEAGDEDEGVEAGDEDEEGVEDEVHRLRVFLVKLNTQEIRVRYRVAILKRIYSYIQFYEYLY